MPPLWAAHIPETQGLALGVLRMEPGLEVLHDSESGRLWLKGSQKLDKHPILDRRIRSLPSVQHFTVLRNGKLLPPYKRLPRGSLPRGSWVPLALWLELDLQAAAFSGQIEDKLPVHFTRSDKIRSSQLLLTELDLLIKWGLAAPEVRLSKLEFTINDKKQALLRGSPLPPLRGTQYVLTDAVAHPIGYDMKPKLDGPSLQILFDLAPGDIAWFPKTTEPYIRLGVQHFSPLTRASLRMCRED